MRAGDPQGRLLTINSSHTGFNLLEYDGQNIIGDYATLSTVRDRYVHGPGVDNPLVRYDDDTNTSRNWMITDERGSVVAEYDSSGTMVGAVNTYDAYGEPGASNHGLMQYAARPWLEGMEVYDNRARSYNPRLGRFMQTDPIGQAGGLNIYNYTGSDPVNATDPSGLATKTKVCITPTGTRIRRCGTVSTEGGLGPSMANRLASRYYSFLLQFGTYKGVSLGGYGRPVTGGTSRKRSYLQAITQFLGAAVYTFGDDEVIEAWENVTSFAISPQSGILSGESSGDFAYGFACVSNSCRDEDLLGNGSSFPMGTILINEAIFGLKAGQITHIVFHEAMHFHNAFHPLSLTHSVSFSEANHNLLDAHAAYFLRVAALAGGGRITCPDPYVFQIPYMCTN